MSWGPGELAWLFSQLSRLHGQLHPTTLAQVEKARDPFRLLVACILSQRTKDAVTAQAAARLLAQAPTPSALAHLPEEKIAQLIYPVGFYRTKASQLRQLAHLLLERHGGLVPASREALLALPAVGRKTANLVLGLAFGIPAICVDTHVHRLANRLGLVTTRQPEETEKALEALLPQAYWIPLNDLLVTLGQNLCTPTSPHCSSCPLAARCPRVGVARHR